MLGTAASLPGRADQARAVAPCCVVAPGAFGEILVCTALAATLGAVLAWFGPPGTDFAAHVYQRALFLRHGFTLWDNFWYAGRYSFIDYSLLDHPLAAFLGTQSILGCRPCQAGMPCTAGQPRSGQRFFSCPAVRRRVQRTLGDVAARSPGLRPALCRGGHVAGRPKRCWAGIVAGPEQQAADRNRGPLRMRGNRRPLPLVLAVAGSAVLGGASYGAPQVNDDVQSKECEPDHGGRRPWDGGRGRSLGRGHAGGGPHGYATTEQGELSPQRTERREQAHRQLRRPVGQIGAAAGVVTHAPRTGARQLQGRHRRDQGESPINTCTDMNVCTPSRMVASFGYTGGWSTSSPSAAVKRPRFHRGSCAVLGFAPSSPAS